MKLLFCPYCNDMFNLSYETKKCSCGRVSGKYDSDGLHATYSGGIAFCINNRDFVEAIEAQKYNNSVQEHLRDSHGVRFDSWICPANSTTFVKEQIAE